MGFPIHSIFFFVMERFLAQIRKQRRARAKYYGGAGEIYSVLHLQFSLHCNHLPLVVTYNNDSSNGFSRKESVKHTADKRNDKECYHSDTSHDDVECSVEVHLRDEGVYILAVCLIAQNHRQQLIKNLEAW